MQNADGSLYVPKLLYQDIILVCYLSSITSIHTVVVMDDDSHETLIWFIVFIKLGPWDHCLFFFFFFKCRSHSEVPYVKEYFKFSSLRSKFITGETAIEVTSKLTQILDFRQILSPLRIM